MNKDWRPKSSIRSTVVLIHGAVVNGLEMNLLRLRLALLGYHTRQFHYRCMTLGLEENARRFKRFLDQTPGDELHVIGHSMGGVVARHVFENWPDERPGRILALGSPLLDLWLGHRLLQAHRLGARLIGKTVLEHIQRPIDPTWQGSREFGVIAGTYSLGAARMFHDLPTPNDGVVLWRETRLQGARHITYKLNHFALLVSQRCMAQMAGFLATGQFQQDESLVCPARQNVPSEIPAGSISNA